jgi:hypothetical protein
MVNLISIPRKLRQRLEEISRRRRDNSQIFRKAEEIAAHVPQPKDMRPVIFFKASTGPSDFTLNNAFNILAAWGLRLQGVPVIHFICERGLKPCVMGTNRQKPATPPPCRSCIAHSKALFAGAEAHWFGFQPDHSLERSLAHLSVPELMKFELSHTITGIPSPIPLGELVTPGLRWILRRHHLFDDTSTRYLYQRYIVSAWSIAREFRAFLDRTHPQAVVVFNGQFYPEAVARWISLSRGIRSLTHEVAFQPFSVFFTEGEATASPIQVPDDFEMDARKDARLDAYLENRFHGMFNMAGIRFWPEIKGLDEHFLDKANQFEQIVPVFTNVIFDTSQPHANTVFSDMFDWLGLVRDLAKSHRETLFVIRAHPDEIRPGKESLETVQDWVEKHAVMGMSNVIFVPPTDYFSSYEFIQRSKFVMVYNSTIGLEAAVMGAPVLCAGKARFTPYNTVFFPQKVADYRSQAESFLNAEKIIVPKEFQKNARRFLYYQLYRIPLLLDAFLTTSTHPSLTRFKDFTWEQLLPQNSLAIATILEGVLHNGDFTVKE